MPIYEYECSNCGRIEEAFQKISDAPLETCSKCQGKMNKIVSHSSFQLKGSGWYVTDYGGSKSSAGKASASKESKSETKAKSEPTSHSGTPCGGSCPSSK